MVQSPTAIVPQEAYDDDALTVARRLLGAHLVRDNVRLRITELEAYRWPHDSANHCRVGRTARNAPMWGPPGHAYVYLCYGLHNLLNLVTGPEGQGAAILVRAAEPVEGLGTIQSRRGGRTGPVLLTGPGKVGAALDLDRQWSHHPLFQSGGLEVQWGERPGSILEGPRVGIGYADPEDIAAPWRLAIGGTRWVSERRTLVPAP